MALRCSRIGFCLLLAACFLSLPVLAAAEEARPNIILIMADDLGYECLGVNGGASYDTPALDAMAAGGMRFTACHAQPLCTPSRVKIMTGKSNARNYVEFQMLPPGERTFAHMLRDAGYATAVAGKWQLYGLDGERAGRGTLPLDAGFDEYCLWQVRNKESRYRDPSIEFLGKPAEKLEGRYGPDVFLEYISEYIGRERDQPFFLYYPMCLPHSPHQPSPDHPDYAVDPLKKDKKYFKSMVEYMDKIVGRILTRLEETGQRENTVVMFIGDNGTDRNIRTAMRDGSEVRGFKGHSIDWGTHVPMIVSWPGQVRAGAVNAELIGFADFLPTFVALADSKLPEDAVVDGHSFLPQLKGERGTPSDALFVHYEPRWGNFTKARFARDHRYKLYDDGRIYDVQADPLEESPLTDAVPEEVQGRLQSALDTFAGVKMPARIVTE